MKIEKKALETALRKAKAFTGKNLPILKQVLIVGENQQVVATDLTTFFFTPLEIKDYVQEVKHKVVFPDDNLKADMESLGKAQLVSLADYAGASPKGTKADIVTAIMDESLKSADADEKRADVEKLSEAFCVDPDRLLKVVGSLELKGSDMLSLLPEVGNEDSGEMFGGDGKVTRLSVGEHFQKLAISDASEFPEYFDVEADEPVAKISGKQLRAIACVCKEAEDAPFKECVFFDADNDNIVATDGNRLHADSVKVDQSVMLNFAAAMGMAGIAKEKDVVISYSPSVRWAVMKFEKDLAYVRVDTDVNFPTYMSFLNATGQSVMVDREKFKKVFSQAHQVSEGDFTAVGLKFNGGIDALLENPGVGTYNRETIEIEGTVDPEVEMSVNPKFMLDALRHIDGDKAEVRVGDGPIYVGSDKFKAAIMPVRV